MAKKKRTNRGRSSSGSNGAVSSHSGGNGKQRARRRRRGGGGGGGGGGNHHNSDREPADVPSDAPLEEGDGILELHPNGYGFLRGTENNYARERSDPFVPGTMIERFGMTLCLAMETRGSSLSNYSRVPPSYLSYYKKSYLS